MEAFTHLSILVSVILALGIAALLSGFAQIIEHRRTALVYSPSVCWALFLLLVHVQTWWTIFGLRSHLSWTFLEFAVLLLQPITLYLLAALTLPQSAAELNLREKYFSHRTWFFTLLIILLLASIVKDLVVNGVVPSAGNLAFHGLFLLIAAIGLLTTADRVHRLIAYAALLAFSSYVALLFSRLS